MIHRLENRKLLRTGVSTRRSPHGKANTPERDKMPDPEEIANTILFMLSASDRGHRQLMAQPAIDGDGR